MTPPGLSFSLPTHAALTGPRKLHAALGVVQYLRDPVRVGMQLRPVSGEGVATTAKGHSAILVCYGERWARLCLTDMERWQRPSGGLVTTPASQPAVQNMMRTIVLANGDEWARRRRAAVPPTSRDAVLDGMHGSFLRSVSELTEQWRQGSVHDVAASMLAVSLRNNVRCLMGLEPAQGELISEKLNYFINSLVDPGIALTQRLANTLRKGTPVPGTPYARWVGTAQSLYDDLIELVRQRRLRRGTADMLGALLAVSEGNESGLTDDEAVGELTGLYAAGYETTGRTLAWTLMLLACHPAAARAVAEEASALLHGDMPTLAQTKALPLLDAVVRESQRLIPAVPSSLPRVASEDLEIEGLKLARGTGLVFSIVAQHHEEALFANAYAFKPGRWDALRRAPGALVYRFLPYGAGPRRCVGGVLADYQLRATLAWLLQRFSFRLPANARVDYHTRQVVLEPARALNMIIGTPDEWPATAELPTGTVRRMVSQV